MVLWLKRQGSEKSGGKETTRESGTSAEDAALLHLVAA